VGITKRPDGRYRARIIGDDGRERAKHFRRRTDAVRWETEQKAAKHRGQWVDPSDRTTVAQYARQWAAARPHRPSTARNVASLIEHHIAATPLGSRRLARVRPSEVQAWASGRALVMSPLRLRNLVSMLRAMYADAVLDHLVGMNPVMRISLPSFDQPRVVPLTVDELRALVGAVPERNRAMVMVQAACGLRIGELLALRVQDVDFLRRTLRVEYQFAPGSKLRTDPKTPRSRRTIPLPTVAAEALAEHMSRFPPTVDGTLFSTRLGTPYRHDYYGARIFKEAVAKANIGRDAVPHDLRHWYASRLLHAGESVVTVAERLGHSNATTVLKTYGHLIEGQEDRTRRAVDQAFESPSAVIDPGDAEADSSQGA
jgi:integrase